MPEQLRIIVDRMLEAVASKSASPDKKGEVAPLDKLSLQEFTVFLNLNPAIRSVIQ